MLPLLLHAKMIQVRRRTRVCESNICLRSQIAAYAKQEQIAEEIMHEVENDLEIDMKDSFTGKWNCMYVRLRFVAVARSVPSV